MDTPCSTFEALPPGLPCPSPDAETLIDDFFAEVERTLRERGIGTTVIAVEENDS